MEDGVLAGAKTLESLAKEPEDFPARPYESVINYYAGGIGKGTKKALGHRIQSAKVRPHRPAGGVGARGQRYNESINAGLNPTLTAHDEEGQDGDELVEKYATKYGLRYKKRLWSAKQPTIGKSESRTQVSQKSGVSRFLTSNLQDVEEMRDRLVQ